MKKDYYFLISLLTIQDIDECVLKTDNCNDNANCTNTKGAYDCHCYGGYRGDGFVCKGKLRI